MAVYECQSPLTGQFNFYDYGTDVYELTYGELSQSPLTGQFNFYMIGKNLFLSFPNSLNPL